MRLIINFTESQKKVKYHTQHAGRKTTPNCWESRNTVEVKRGGGTTESMLQGVPGQERYRETFAQGALQNIVMCTRLFSLCSVDRKSLNFQG